MIAVIGAGKWGQALHYALSEKNECVLASSRGRSGKNLTPLKEALKAPYLIFAIPAQLIAQWLKEHYSAGSALVLVASKGVDAKDGRFLDEIYKQYVPEQNLAFLSGPSFAAEVQKGLPCALVISSQDVRTSREFASFFPRHIRTYTSPDVRGAEICGAYKNVIAIASGICDGLGLGNNARASLIARGLVEMARFGKHFGAQDETFMGLSGAGDLFLTASSTLSRNYRVGLGLAKDKSLEQILNELCEVAEGVFTAKAIAALASKEQIYTPIVSSVLEILNGAKASTIAWGLIQKD